MKKNLKIIVVVFALILFVLSAIFEFHHIFSLIPKNQNALRINGFDFIEITSYDGLMNNDGKLFDVLSLTPKLLQTNDCST